MTIRALSRAEVRSIDARAADELGLSTLVLMENAGHGAARLLRRHAAPGGRVVVACGSGNNGGDGGVVARHLDAWGFDVRVVWFADPTRLAPDARAQHDILARAGIAQEDWPGEPPPERLEALLDAADWVVDGLLGTGLSRPVDGPLRRVIAAINAAGRPVLALDLPSGLDCDTGQPLGLAVQARLTASFVAPKRGFDTPDARRYTGEVHVVEIGVPRLLLAPFQQRDHPARP